ncbi:MAG: aminotransferase class V-fold PLP-dependent enzyme [Defluviitaleaceae bacterium]|nr:aminotransferase class V-fold PLP-dependent enzyme [Defluviitaleaceae bacterium]
MIYFDNAATASELPWQAGDGLLGNPSSPHGLGIQAERKMDAARKTIADILCVQPRELTFTSGGTESNNMAILGFAKAHARQSCVIFAEPWEHPSIIEPIKNAQDAMAVIAPMAEWHIPPDRPSLVCLSHVNHETGRKMPCPKNFKDAGAVVLVDGAQGFCKEAIDLRYVDAYSFSGHKFHGPGGVGGFWLRPGFKVNPLLYGGGQEGGLRPGSENLSGILKMAAAAEAVTASQPNISEINTELRNIINELPDVFINSPDDASAYILNISFMGVNGETLVHLLSEKEVYVSMGAACRSRKKVKSGLELIGHSQDRAKAAVRFSFSIYNNIDEARRVKALLVENVSQLRRVLGYRGMK